MVHSPVHQKVGHYRFLRAPPRAACGASLRVARGASPHRDFLVEFRIENRFNQNLISSKLHSSFIYSFIFRFFRRQNIEKKDKQIENVLFTLFCSSSFIHKQIFDCFDSHRGPPLLTSEVSRWKKTICYFFFFFFFLVRECAVKIIN